MKTLQTTPAWLLYLFAPLVAFAQGAPFTNDGRTSHQVTSSPLLWYWVVALVVAAVAFALFSVRLSKRRQPPHPPGTP